MVLLDKLIIVVVVGDSLNFSYWNEIFNILMLIMIITTGANCAATQYPGGWWYSLMLCIFFLKLFNNIFKDSTHLTGQSAEITNLTQGINWRYLV